MHACVDAFKSFFVCSIIVKERKISANIYLEEKYLLTYLTTASVWQNLKLIVYKCDIIRIGVRAMGLEGCSPLPPDSGKTIIFFGQKLNFSGRSHQPKMKKLCIY